MLYYMDCRYTCMQRGSHTASNSPLLPPSSPLLLPFHRSSILFCLYSYSNSLFPVSIVCVCVFCTCVFFFLFFLCEFPFPRIASPMAFFLLLQPVYLPFPPLLSFVPQSCMLYAPLQKGGEKEEEIYAHSFSPKIFSSSFFLSSSS
ncbi:hypothetical protein F4775DRAFT_213864 [Biscogniauxia sp. FL1348]|nr:hypothetical protein F4775DRAFT_213864 [Biscogniauxia sp. FL1348]